MAIMNTTTCLHDTDFIGWNDNARDMVNYECPGWYFWDLDEGYYHGPFNTKEDCDNAWKNYYNLK